MNISNILKYYFCESENNLPLIITKNNTNKEIKIKSILEELLIKYSKYIKIFHNSPITINELSKFQSKPNIILTNILKGKEIINNPLLILSLYMSLNLTHYVENHPRYKDIFHYILYNTSFPIYYKNSPFLLSEYMQFSPSDQIKEFILNVIILYNKNIILNRILNKSQIDNLIFNDFNPNTWKFILSNQIEIFHILKQYNMIL